MRKHEDKIFILNPTYNLRSDKKRVILYNSSIDPGIRTDETDILVYLNPLYAAILSLFDGRNNLGNIMKDLAKALKMPSQNIKRIVEPLLNNSEGFNFNYDGHRFFLPRQLLIEKEPSMDFREFQTAEFMIPRKELDLKSWRLYRPLDAIFMINNICKTNCIYCYADRRKKYDCRISFGRLKEIIEEAKTIGLRSFDLTGGEVLLYPEWPGLLNELLTNGFSPYISTKIPLDIKTIQTLKDIGISRIQVSLDSVVTEELQKILSVGADYCNELLNSIKNLDQYGFDIYTNSQITKYNRKNVEKLINFLLGLKNIKRINLSSAGFSLYTKKNYSDYAVSLNEIKQIEAYIETRKQNVSDNIQINFSGYTQLADYQKNDKKTNFDRRARCSGNFYAFVILPNGHVTACEELYFHPAFKLGNLKDQSIMEMWNSREAMGLYMLSKKRIQPSSPCSYCTDFDSCHQTKGICWKEILYAYGDENWDYPDPRCPKAPPVGRQFYLE